jgi:prevent-host-death family protein
MTTTVGSYEAKTHLPKLLERVALGEHITITRSGKPIARLVPYEDDLHHQRHSAIENIMELRKGNRLGGLSIRNLIHT